MQFQNIIGILACAALLSFTASCSKEAQAEPPQRSADDVLSGMRLRSLSKELELNDEQKVHVRALFDQETAEIAKLNADTTLSVTQRLNKIAELKKETYTRIKPLLTNAQTEKLDQMLSKSERRRTRS